MEKLNDLLRKARKEKHLTLEELSIKSGVSYVTISKIENDLSKPTAVVLGKLANALELDLNELFELNGGEK